MYTDTLFNKQRKYVYIFGEYLKDFINLTFVSVIGSICPAR